LNRPKPVLTAIHKFSTATTLASAGVPVPDAFLSLDDRKFNEARPGFGEEAVYKTAIGTHGGGTWKVGREETVNAKVGQRQAFLQKLIETDGKRHSDLRVYIVGDEIVGAMNRFAPKNDWRTNVALGGDVKGVTDSLSDEVKDIAMRAKEAVGLDYAGVDIVGSEGDWYVLEVNPTAGFKGLFKATGVSAGPYIARLAIEEAGGEVDDERVKELSKTLDDSTPRSMPRPKTKSKEPMVIGYTEKVTVSGTSGTETVIAKSDTGASRTSIDIGLAAEVGAGPIKNITRVKSGSRKSSKSRPVVDLVVGVGGGRHTVTASVEDRTHMDYPLLLGRDILKDYHVDVRRRAGDEEE
ncbi:MAG: ATP-grasp domain-containing protein, partial [Halobacteria archaeon]|nr:ATP-grasp domain-containing protein [Halobacteria archaeon]